MGADVPAREGTGLVCGGPVVLVVSPHAGHVGGASPRAALEAAGVVVGEQIAVSDLDHRLPQGAAWRARGMVAAVAAGGDGTIGAVATQIAGSGLSLGILPLGTSNDVARALGVPLGLAAACEAVAHRMPVEVDIGQALPAMTEPRALATEPDAHMEQETSPALRAALAASGAYFVHALTLGLNVSFARLATDVARRQRWGSLTYATSALEAVTHFEPVPVTLRLTGARTLESDGVWHTADGDLDVTCRAVQVAVVNTPVFAGAMNLRMPRVDMHDRLLDILVIEALEPPTLRETVEALLEAVEKLGESFQSWHRPRSGVSAGAPRQGTTHAGGAGGAAEADAPVVPVEPVEPVGPAIHRLPGVRRFQAESAMVRTPQHVDVTLDGEIRAHTPVQVRIAPEPLRVFLPE